MEKLNIDKQELKRYGITMGGIFLVIAVFIFIRHKHSILFAPVMSVALIFLVVAASRPIFLKPAYLVWMKFALALSWINTRLILIVIFYLVFTPIGLVMRLCGIDLLTRKIDKQRGSYWEKKAPSIINYEKQF